MSPVARDLRLLPAAAAAWLACLLGVRAPAGVAAVVVLVCLVVVVAAAARARRPPSGRHRARTHGRTAATVLVTAMCAAMLLAWSWSWTQLRAQAVAPVLGSQVQAQIRIDSEPRQLEAGRLLLHGTWERAGAAVDVVILADPAWSDVVVGSQVRATVDVAQTGAGDAAAALLVPSSDPHLVARPPPVAAVVASLRAGLRHACLGLDAQGRGLVPGIAIGDDRALPQSLVTDMRTVSLTHVTAVSGAHVAMVTGIVLLALRRVPRVPRALLAGVVLAALVVLVHPSASVLRSAAMGAVLLVGLALERPRAALPALWASVVGLLAVDPWLAGSFGFVLSVLATTGLLLGSQPLTDRWARLLPRPIALALAVPVAAQVACLPALALLQPQMPVHGVLANLLAAPAIPPATVLGLLATVTYPWLPGAGTWLAETASIATAWVTAVAVWCARLPVATVPWWQAVSIAVLTVVIVVVARRLGRRCRQEVAGLTRATVPSQTCWSEPAGSRSDPAGADRARQRIRELLRGSGHRAPARARPGPGP